MNFKAHIRYSVDNKNKYATASNDDLKINFDCGNSRVNVSITALKEIEVSEFYLETKYSFDENSKVFANGFQSWTDAREFGKDEKMPTIGLVGKTFVGKMLGLQYVGDYTFVPSTNEKGVIHSHSYTYIRNSDEIELVGSLSDRTGYTVFESDMNGGKLRVYKDLDGIKITGEYNAFSLFLGKGEYDRVFDSYFSAMRIVPLTNKKLKGYTSWYNYYQNINESIILNDLNAIAETSKDINTFQVDDGYQTAVGDWLSIDKAKFPNGMKKIADGIHEKGLQAGLWLAPFGAQKNSALAKEHSDWLIKDENGKPICVGANWGGFYAIDIYNEDARKYIKNVFNTVLNTWGFDLVKLDFLYAASILPRNNKTRGEIAYDAIDFLRECVGEKMILGCGVQMMPCFGKVEYMRIGADMALQWKHSTLRKMMHREDVSTPNAIGNSIYRRHLNGRAFLCDPDVFLLRDNNIKFSFEERKLLAKFIKIFGGVLFTSDDVKKYSKEQMDCFNDTLSESEAKLISVQESENNVKIIYEELGKTKELKFDRTNGI